MFYMAYLSRRDDMTYLDAVQIMPVFKGGLCKNRERPDISLCKGQSGADWD